MMKRAVRVAAGVVVEVGWLTVSLLILVAAWFVPDDEESAGWSAVLLNPYLMAPYTLYTVLSGAGLWLLFRRPR